MDIKEKKTMMALMHVGKQVILREDYPIPQIKQGWALIQLLKAGICNTDIQVTKGYSNFEGVLGHQCIGIVKTCQDLSWVGKRVAIQINFTCNKCSCCNKGLGRHCPNRTTLGIVNQNGCFSQFFLAPIHCLIEIPEQIPLDVAVFIEPLSAACQILEQLQGNYAGSEKVYVLGDGKLGILCTWVLSTVFKDITLIGHHQQKLQLAQFGHIKTATSVEGLQKADYVVEATGCVGGFKNSIDLCKPRGTLILKSTIAANDELNLSMIVVNEITILGSRCGRFRDGLKIMKNHKQIPLQKLISGEYKLEEGIKALDHAKTKGSLKILLNCNT